MRYAVAFGGLAAVCFAAAALAAVHGGAPALAQGLVSAWFGASFTVVSLAYLGAGPRLLGKQPDGALAWWSLGLNAPFLLLALASMRAVHAALREDPWTEVAPGLFLGRRPTRADAAGFRALGVTGVLDLCAELPASRARTGLEAYASVPVLDARAPSLEALTLAVSWIDHQRPHGPVYVHCALGRSRGATVAAAWRLAHRLDPDAAAAERALVQLRPVVELSAEQRATLEAFHAGLG
jgi:hypothetical protein